MSKLKAFDMFSGYGGFRLAGEQAGIDFVGYCEMDKWAVKFYNQAFDTKEEVYFKDATKIDTRELPEFDILFAGFPCQAFSIAGKRQGFNDTRGTLFFDVVRICEVKRPRYILLENVKGLLNHDNGRTFVTIIKILTDIGYTVEAQVLNTKFFGLPQNRERVFIVGRLGGGGIGKIFPIKRNGGQNPCADQKETLVYWKNSKEKWVQEEKSYCPALKTQSDVCRQTLIYQLPRGNNEGGFKDICPTITSHQFEYNNVLYDGKRLRLFTPLEKFRLQGFPDEVFYKGSRGISDTQLRKGAGNSVSVNVVYEVVERILKVA